MKFDKRILELSKTIYQTSVMCHNAKGNPTKQIDKIRGMIREFIRLEVVPYELTESEKTTFIVENELKITSAFLKTIKESNVIFFVQMLARLEARETELFLKQG